MGKRMAFWARIYSGLGDRRIFRGLLLLNAIVTLVIMWVSSRMVLSDTWSYLGLAQGILHGNYSMWWELGPDYPDTFRTPGYPLLIAFFIRIFGSWKSVLVVQFLFYCASLWLTFKTVDILGGRREVKSMFLLLLLPLVNVPFYITQLYTEIPVLAALSLSLYLILRSTSWGLGKAVFVGLLFGFVFQCKPIFLLFPLMFVVIQWFGLSENRDRVGLLLMLGIFLVTLLPYGAWNYQHHGVFKVTPLQGSGSYMHLGYWSGKTPGYTDRFYLRNFNGDEVLHFTPKDSVAANIRKYESEWKVMNDSLYPLLTAKDTAMWNAAPSLSHPAELTYNTQYTLLRDKMLLNRAIGHYLADPGYTILFKTYSAVRLWVIGIQIQEFRSASIPGKLKMIYATASTGIIFLLLIICLPWVYLKHGLSFKKTWPMILFLLYFTFVHLPFTIQSRYTVPVRFMMLALLAFAVVWLIQGRTIGADAGEDDGQQ